MKKIISGKTIYLTEINSNRLSDLARSESVNIISGGEYAIFRMEGQVHGGKYCQRYFLITEINDFCGILFTQRLERPVYLKLSEKSEIKKFFSRSRGVNRVLLVKISKKFKEWYLERREEFKKELKELLTWKGDSLLW